MGERPVHIRQTEQKAGSLKEELDAIFPQLEEMRKSKVERKNQFVDVIGQIQKVSSEIYGLFGYDSYTVVIDENDLSLRRLEELQNKMQSLEKEKSDRLRLVTEHLNDLSSLCYVLGLGRELSENELHPSLADSEESHSIRKYIIGA